MTATAAVINRRTISAPPLRPACLRPFQSTLISNAKCPEPHSSLHYRLGLRRFSRLFRESSRTTQEEIPPCRQLSRHNWRQIPYLPTVSAPLEIDFFVLSGCGQNKGNIFSAAGLLPVSFGAFLLSRSTHRSRFFASYRNAACRDRRH